MIPDKDKKFMAAVDIAVALLCVGGLVFADLNLLSRVIVGAVLLLILPRIVREAQVWVIAGRRCAEPS